MSHSKKQKRREQQRNPRIAVVSLLFNWPSSGGGIMDTVGLVRGLRAAGFVVQHIYARREEWGVGRVVGKAPGPSEAVSFTDAEWTREGIVRKLRAAVAAFGPDYVVLTDSWCFKPHLAEAAAGRPYFLRFHAAETACPLNNLRVQANPDGSFADCPHHFLGEPSACLACLEAHRALAPGPPGNLHHTERLLAGVQAGREYHARLREALQQAQGLLVYNRTLQELFAPYHPRTYVVPSGVDRSRFVNLPLREPDPPVKTLLFAGVAEEPVKGYDVLLAAFTRLLRQRRDVHLQVTADPPGPVTDYVTFTGWQSQEDLPSVYAQADVCVVPSVWAEAFGIVAVEAMAAGKPVVASRTGGLAETVVEGETGLLFERGNAAELADKITVLLDDPARRERLGRAGQARVGERYTWEKVIQRYYRPLFQGEEPASSSS